MISDPTFSDLLRLDGQRALVTGGSGNIGRGIAKRLAEAGAHVAVHFHRGAEQAAAAVDEIVALGVRGASVGADLESSDSVATMFDTLSRDDLAPDIIVNNAGIYPVAPLSDMSAADWRQTLAANLNGPFLVTRTAAERLRAAGRPGAIVNIASIEGLDPAPAHSHYATSKAGLIMFSRACAAELGPNGIRVNTVSPGLIHREGIEEGWPEGVQRWQDKVPLGRLGSSFDVADAVLFLVSPASRWITGTNLVVDGGITSISKW